MPTECKKVAKNEIGNDFAHKTANIQWGTSSSDDGVNIIVKYSRKSFHGHQNNSPLPEMLAVCAKYARNVVVSVLNSFSFISSFWRQKTNTPKQPNYLLQLCALRARILSLAAVEQMNCRIVRWIRGFSNVPARGPIVCMCSCHRSRIRPGRETTIPIQIGCACTKLTFWLRINPFRCESVVVRPLAILKCGIWH